ncbi:hypothetical protein F4779DRAFT_613982 [Xylariaceae sp. FL0662B]|nr:hypothetical protein F4779DRAFT_613982 [Xylariaceae sp. FL0662B]
MPPHLHPRSRMTSSLFATTVAASFFVVGLPHLLPCPAPRVAYADSETAPDGTKRRRRRRPQPAEVRDGIAQFESSGSSGTSEEDFARAAAARRSRREKKRECPVPKPGGAIGELMGFNNNNNSGTRKTSRTDRHQGSDSTDQNT